MKIKPVIFILTATVFTHVIKAQQFTYERVNFKDIRKEVSTEKSAFYYPVLSERYNHNDTTLTKADFRYLYFGYTFQDGYSPYETTDAETIINELQQKDTIVETDLSVMLEKCREVLKIHPFSAHYLLISAVTCQQSGLAEEARNFYFKYQGVISAILSSGDGASEKSAWSVILISDEYEMIHALGFQSTGKQKMLGKSLCDFIYVQANDYNIDGFYFDISSPFTKGFK
jgi:hypothetical protein